MLVATSDSPVEQLSPAFKSWLDNVIVPALVQEYLTETKVRDGIDSESTLGTEPQLTTDPSREGHS